MKKFIIIMTITYCSVFLFAESTMPKKSHAKETTSLISKQNCVPLNLETQKDLDEIKKILHDSYEGDDRTNYKALQENYKKYKDIIIALGQRFDKEQIKFLEPKENKIIDDSLCIMAYHVAQEPQRIDELLHYYRNPAYEQNGNAAHVIRLPSLNPQHVKTKYLYTWEYLLLAPPGVPGKMFTVEDSKQVPVEAIRGIHDPGSIPVLILYFKLVNRRLCRGDNGFMTLATLFTFPTTQSMDGILKCLTIARKNQNNKSSTYMDKPFTEYVIENLSGRSTLYLSKKEPSTTKCSPVAMFPPGILSKTQNVNKLDTAKWQKVIENYPKKNLPDWQKNLLNEILKKIREKEQQGRQ